MTIHKNLFGYLFLILITSIFATLLIQQVFGSSAYPFHTLTDSAMQTYIHEWFSPDFHQMIWQPFAFLILVLIGVGMIGKSSHFNNKDPLDTGVWLWRS